MEYQQSGGNLFSNSIDSYKINIHTLSKHNFTFHKVVDPGGSIVMCKCLSEDTLSHIPPSAHTMVRVSALVVNRKRDIVVIQEHVDSRIIPRLPSNYVDPSEDMSMVAICIVKEATGIETRLKFCICFHQTHNTDLNRSVLHFVVLLYTLIYKYKYDDSNYWEEDCILSWMKEKDFESNSDVSELEKEYFSIEGCTYIL